MRINRQQAIWGATVALIGAAVLAFGCSLNPQPLPPGGDPEPGSGTTTPTPEQSGGSGNDDNGATTSAALDAGEGGADGGAE